MIFFNSTMKSQIRENRVKDEPLYLKLFTLVNKLLFDPSFFWYTASCILIGEAILNILIIKYVSCKYVSSFYYYIFFYFFNVLKKYLF